MDYYEIFGLKREPFSNSPDPELFYATPKYLEVLHKLEIAIRLKRGLNLVLGDVGTGKTTMSRVLLRTLDQEREKFLVRLILDPGFPSDEEMLSYLLSLLGGGQGLSGSRTLLMDSLQRLLLRLTTEEGKVVAIFIDEGQKLSPSGLEILRELLNFESNQWKLIQIVVFGQWELWDKFAAMGNLLDRVNLVVRLSPLSLKETRAMIHHRLKVCGMNPSSPIFSEKAIDLIYQYTAGHPRKVVSLCHHSMLVALMRGESSVTPQSVRRALREMEGILHRKKSSSLKRALIAASVTLVLSSLVGGGLLLQMDHSGSKDENQEVQGEVRPDASGEKEEPVSLAQTNGIEGEASWDERPPPSPPGPRVSILSPYEWLQGFEASTELDSTVEVVVRRGDTLSGIVERHLNMVLDTQSPWMKRFAMANPHVPDPNRLAPGVKIRLPVVKAPQRVVPGEPIAWFPSSEEASAWATKEIEEGKERLLLVAREKKGHIHGFGVYRPLRGQGEREGAEGLEEGRIELVLVSENLGTELLR